MTKQPHITESTRRNLLEAFWLLYKKQGIEHVTVRDVAARAGYNRGTFYEYFRDVRDCLDRIEAECIPKLDELPPVPGEAGVSAEFIDAFISLYSDRFERYDVLLGERGDPAFRRRLIDGIKELIVAAAPAEVMSADDGRDLDYLLEFELSGLVGILWRFFRTSPRGRAEEIVAIAYRILDGERARRLRERLAASQRLRGTDSTASGTRG
jgi:AcrR family transcriptional regulator